jgi:glycolate oxidase iron-sulfur subunit
LLNRKLDHLERTGATIVASANPGCSLQLEAGLRQAGHHVRVAHPISLFAEALRRAEIEGVAANNSSKPSSPRL